MKQLFLQKKRMRFVTLFLLVLLVCATGYESRASNDTKVWVGFFEGDSYIQRAADGSYAGYGVEYFSEIASLTGLEFAYVKIDRDEAQNALAEKKIDLLCLPVSQITDQERFLVSKQSFSDVYYALYTTEKNDSLYYEDFEMLSGKKIGFLPDVSGDLSFQQYASFHKFTYFHKNYQNKKELEQAFERKEIDAAFVPISMSMEHAKLIGRIGSEELHFVSYKESSLIPILDDAVINIRINHQSFEKNLQDKYYVTGAIDNQLCLTREEADYIAENKTIKIGFLPNIPPVSKVEEETGVLSGITVDIVGEIEKISGLHFEKCAIPVGEKPIDFLMDKKVTLVAGVLRNTGFLSKNEITLSDPIMYSHLVMVGKKGEVIDPTKKQTIAITKAFQSLQEYILKNYPNLEMIYLENNEQCLNAVVKGDAKLMIQNSYVISNWLNSPRYETLEIVPTYFLEEHDCIAALNTVDPRLLSIINKSIAIMPEEKMNQIVVANTFAKPYKMSLRDSIYQYRVSLLILSFSIGLCLFMLCLVLINRQLQIHRVQSANSKLREAVNAAEEANQMKSIFLSRMSHEIRTPIHAITSIVSIASQNTEQPDKIKNYLAKIKSSSQYLLAIINDILDLSAIENKKIKIAKVDFNLKEQIDSIVNLYYILFREKGISLRVILKEVKEELLCGDSFRLNQILNNLLSNAYKFTDDGGSVTITITQKEVAENNCDVIFEVADTGCGIAKEFLESVFEPFEQQDAVIARRYGGSGLGLAITKQLIELMNGNIGVVSTEGEGSVFTVEIPCSIQKNNNYHEHRVSANCNLLFVDSEKETRVYLEGILRKESVSCCFCENMEQAIIKIEESYDKKDPFTICIMEWDIFLKDPMLFLEQLGKKGGKSISLILSSYDSIAVQSNAMLFGVAECMTKPIFKSAILEKISVTQKDDLQEKMIDNYMDNRNYVFKGCRILLVEDVEINREIEMELLQLTGAVVDLAEDGQKAVELFDNSVPGTYDIILMDIQMPVLNGYEASKVIRAKNREDAKKIPIIAMTADVFLESKEAALAAGMNDQIAKGSDTVYLYEMIARYWKDSSKRIGDLLL